MPRKFTHRKGRKVARRPARKFVHRNKRRQTAPRSFGFAPLGRTQATNHRYVQTVGLNPAAGGVSKDAVYRANSMFAPAVVAGGHQPYGFDQMSPLYKYYCVTGSRLKISTAQVSNVNAFWLMAILADDSTALDGLSLDQLLERSGTHKVLYQPGQSPKSTSMTFSARKFFTRMSVLDDPNLSGLVTGDPPLQCFYHIVVASIDSGADLTNIPITVQIDYHAVWHVPNDLAQSS